MTAKPLQTKDEMVTEDGMNFRLTASDLGRSDQAITFPIVATYPGYWLLTCLPSFICTEPPLHRFPIVAWRCDEGMAHPDYTRHSRSRLHPWLSRDPLPERHGRGCQYQRWSFSSEEKWARAVAESERRDGQSGARS
jgi:hypothetical protein